MANNKVTGSPGWQTVGGEQKYGYYKEVINQETRIQEVDLGYEGIRQCRPKFIWFEFTGLRENTEHWVFFGGKDVTKWIKTGMSESTWINQPRTSIYKDPGDKYVSETAYPTDLGGPDAASGPLVTDATGTLSGIFYLQSNNALSFPTGTRHLKALDVETSVDKNALSFADGIYEAIGNYKLYGEYEYTVDVPGTEWVDVAPPYSGSDGGDPDGGGYGGDCSCDPPDTSCGGDGGGGDGGGSIICTALHKKGLLPEYIYKLDEEYGQKADAKAPGLLEGYHAWAKWIVQWMERDPNQINPFKVGPINLIPNDAKRIDVAEAWSTNWAEKIAWSWAMEMAHQMGAKDPRTGELVKSSRTGKTLMALGYPLSRMCGWIKRKRPGKKPGLFTAWSLIALLAFFRLIVFVCNEKISLNSDGILEITNG